MKGQFKVNKTNQHPDRPYCVDGSVNGQRRRFYFATREQAEEKMRLENLQLRNFGHAAANIDADLRIEALCCQRKLEGTGVTLTQAVNAFLELHLARSKSVTVQEAWEAYLAHMKVRVESNEISQVHLDGIIVKCSDLAQTFALEQLCDITNERIQDWLTTLKKRDGKAMSTTSRNSYRLGISGLFAYALDRKWISANPMKSVRSYRTRRDQARRPDILSVEQAARLLEAADRKYLPAIAIGLFAGLRPSEVRRLSWENIHWSKREIDVLAISSKTARYRYVPMSDNLCQWLAPYRNETGRLYSCTDGWLAEGISEIGRLAGIAKWPKDVLRHSYGSHLYASTENAHLTAKRMGHMTTEMLHSNYNNRRTKEEGEAYFEIRPSSEAQAKIVEIAA